jgi:hypothetical protein
MKRIGLPLAAIVTTLSLSLTACGGAPSKDDLVDALTEDNTFTDDQAECIADEILDSDLSDEQLEAFNEDTLEDTDLSSEEQAEVSEVIIAATTTCISE